MWTLLFWNKNSYSEIPIPTLNAGPALIQISFWVQPPLRLSETRLCLVLQTCAEVLSSHSASNQIYVELQCRESKLRLTLYTILNCCSPCTFFFPNDLCQLFKVALSPPSDVPTSSDWLHKPRFIRALLAWNESTYFVSETQLHKLGIFWGW